MTTMTGIRKYAFFFNTGVYDGNALGILFENGLSGYRRLARPEYCFIIIIYSYFWRWRSLLCVFSERSIASSERRRVASCKISVINSLQVKNLPIIPRCSSAHESVNYATFHYP